VCLASPSLPFPFSLFSQHPDPLFQISAPRPSLDTRGARDTRVSPFQTGGTAEGETEARIARSWKMRERSDERRLEI